MENSVTFSFINCKVKMIIQWWLYNDYTMIMQYNDYTMIIRWWRFSNSFIYIWNIWRKELCHRVLGSFLIKMIMCQNNVAQIFWLKIEKWTYYSKDNNVFVHFLFLSSPHSLQSFSLPHLVWSQHLDVYLYYAIVHLFLRANILLKLSSNAELVYYDLVEFLNKRKKKY